MTRVDAIEKAVVEILGNIGGFLDPGHAEKLLDEIHEAKAAELSTEGKQPEARP